LYVFKELAPGKITAIFHSPSNLPVLPIFGFHPIDLHLIVHLIDLHLATARPPTCLTALISLLSIGPIVGPYVTSCSTFPIVITSFYFDNLLYAT
jgi:hypothetical protein